MKKLSDKQNTIIVVILIFSILILFFSIMVIYSLNNDKEGKFRKNHEVSEAVGKLIKYETYTKSADAVLEYNVDGNKHTMHQMPLMTMELGDEFIVLYDKNDPDESMYLRDRPILPDKDTNQVNGYITFYKKWKFDSEIDFKYSADGEEHKREQFFAPDKNVDLTQLKKFYDGKKSVVVIFPNDNPWRGYIDLTKTLAAN